MCYGSGCLKEDHMGNCRVMDYAPYRETKFRCPCLLYGNENEVIQYYLKEEEYQELYDLAMDNKNELRQRVLIDLAWERYENDEEGKETIKEIESNYDGFHR